MRPVLAIAGLALRAVLREPRLLLCLALSLPAALALSFGPPAAGPAERLGLAREAFMSAAAAFGVLFLLLTAARVPLGRREDDPLEAAPAGPAARVAGVFRARSLLSGALLLYLGVAEALTARALGGEAPLSVRFPDISWEGPTVEARDETWGFAGESRLRLRFDGPGRGVGALLFLHPRGSFSRSVPARVGWEGGGAVETTAQSGLPFTFDPGPPPGPAGGVLAVEVLHPGILFRAERWAFRLEDGPARHGLATHLVLLWTPLVTLSALTASAARFLSPAVAAFLGAWFVFQSAAAGTTRDLAVAAGASPPRPGAAAAPSRLHRAALRALSIAVPDASEDAPLLDLRSEGRACPPRAALVRAAARLPWVAAFLGAGCLALGARGRRRPP